MVAGIREQDGVIDLAVEPVLRPLDQLERDTRTANFYRFWNEVPTILFLIIVAMAVAEPF